MRILRKPIGVMLALIMLLSGFSVLQVSAAPAVLDTGEVGAQGDNVIWTITDDNVLTLSGTGATADYSTSPGWDDPGRHGPWWYSEYADRVKTVVVEEGITHLGKCLFEGDTHLTSAELPDSLETLGDRVFCSCSLTELPNLGTLPEITPAEPDKYYIPEELVWEEGTQGAAVGGENYALYITIANQFSYVLSNEVPAVEGAALEEYRLTGLLDLLFVYVTAEHYTDASSVVEERILTPTNATAAGEKQICVYCAGGCGEIVETRTEPIPATGEPAEPTEPADSDNVCPWCSETHDKSTLTGFFTEFIHDLLYIIRQICVAVFAR